jgi:hypothetical protein
VGEGSANGASFHPAQPVKKLWVRDDADGFDFKGDLEAAESLFRFGDQNDTSPGVRAAPIGATSRTFLLEPSFWTFIAVSSCLTTCRRLGGSHTAYFQRELEFSEAQVQFGGGEGSRNAGGLRSPSRIPKAV